MGEIEPNLPDKSQLVAFANKLRFERDDSLALSLALEDDNSGMGELLAAAYVESKGEPMALSGPKREEIANKLYEFKGSFSSISVMLADYIKKHLDPVPETLKLLERDEYKVHLTRIVGMLQAGNSQEQILGTIDIIVKGLGRPGSVIMTDKKVDPKVSTQTYKKPKKKK